MTKKTKDQVWHKQSGEYVSLNELRISKAKQKKRWKQKNKSARLRRASGRR